MKGPHRDELAHILTEGPRIEGRAAEVLGGLAQLTIGDGEQLGGELVEVGEIHVERRPTSGCPIHELRHGELPERVLTQEPLSGVQDLLPGLDLLLGLVEPPLLAWLLFPWAPVGPSTSPEVIVVARCRSDRPSWPAATGGSRRGPRRDRARTGHPGRHR